MSSSSSSSSSSSNSPCAACKIQRRKCTQDCMFAPYFPADNPQRFAYVHKVFGASNVAKLLNEINESQREDAVKSLAYEAEARLRDPIYGCVGFISVLQEQLKHLQTQLIHAKKELASYVGPQAMLPPPLFTTTHTPAPNNIFPIQPQGYHFSFNNNNNEEGPSASSFQNLVISPQQPSFISQKMIKSEGDKTTMGREGLA